MRYSLRRFASARTSVVVAPLAAVTLLVAGLASGTKPGQPVSGAAGGTAQQRLSVISGKVSGLIGRMTLAEKVGQLQNDGFLTVANGNIELTRAGLLQIDRLLPAFFEAEHRGTRYTLGIIFHDAK